MACMHTRSSMICFSISRYSAMCTSILAEQSGSVLSLARRPSMTYHVLHVACVALARVKTGLAHLIRNVFGRRKEITERPSRLDGEWVPADVKFQRCPHACVTLGAGGHALAAWCQPHLPAARILRPQAKCAPVGRQWHPVPLLGVDVRQRLCVAGNQLPELLRHLKRVDLWSGLCTGPLAREANSPLPWLVKCASFGHQESSTPFTQKLFSVACTGLQLTRRVLPTFGYLVFFRVLSRFCCVQV